MDTDQTTRDTFGLVGPTYLTTVNWESPTDKRIVIASLIKGAYVSELDRRKKRHGSAALAPPWWQFFNFVNVQELNDGRSIFGRVYQLTHSPAVTNSGHHHHPIYVIAFRGTIKKRQYIHSAVRDLPVNLSLISTTWLNNRSRFRNALETIRLMVNQAGSPDKVWVAGHSQGAAIAMLAGKIMMKEGISITSYLFNPPFISSSTLIGMIKDQTAAQTLRHGHSVLKETLARSIPKVSSEEPRNEFIGLSRWVPNLFVHPSDHLCSEFIRYFQKMRDGGGIDDSWKVALDSSSLKTFRGVFAELFLGKGSNLPVHIIPSARLAVNRTEIEGFRDAHALRQWWKPDIHLEEQLYQFGSG